MTELAATCLDAAWAGLSVLDGEQTHLEAPFGDGPPLDIDAKWIGRVVATGDVWTTGPGNAERPAATRPSTSNGTGVRFWAGAPVIDAKGACTAVLWVASPERREIGERERRVLSQLADLAAAHGSPRTSEPSPDAGQPSEELQVRMLDAVGQAVVATDPVGTIIYWNEAAEELYGWSAEKVIGRTITDVTPTDATVEQARDIMASLQRGEAWEGEFRVRRRDGTEFPAYVTDTPVFDECGRLAAVIGVSIDLSERNQMARQLRRSERLFAKLFHNSPVAACILSLPELRFIDVNEGYSKLVGQPPSSLLGRTTSELGLRINAPVRTRAVTEIQQEGYVRNARFQLPTASGDERTVLVSAEVMELDGQACAVAQLTDITDLERARARLTRSEARWQRLVESHPEPIVVSSGGEIIYTNPATVRLLGAESVAELEGLSFYDMVPEAHRTVLRERLEAQQAGQQLGMKEYPIRTLDGDLRHVEAAGVPIQLDGRDALLTVARDITERKKMEQALRESKHFLGATLDALSAHIAVLNEQGTIIDTNAAWRCFAEQNGAQPHATGIGTNYLAACDKGMRAGAEAAAPVADAIRDLLAGRRETFSREYPCHSDDTRRWFVVRASRFEIDGAVRVVIAHENVTDRKVAELEAARRERMQGALIDALPDAVVRVHTSGRVIDARLPASTPFFNAQDVRAGRYLQELLLDPYSPIILDYVEDASTSGETRKWKCLMKHQTPILAFEVRFVPSGPDEVLIIIRDVSRERQLEAEIIEVSAREQRRIGRDIHDGLGQTLTGLSYMSRSLVRRLEGQPAEHAVASRIATEIEEAIRVAHALSHGLNPVELVDDELARALDEMAQRIENVHGIDCRFEQQGDVGVADAVATYHLYRIAQEATNNAVKHAAAPRIEMALTRDEGQLVLRIRDEGQGMTADAIPARGMGLQTMRYRASLIGASLRIHSVQDAGTVVTCILPVDAAA